MKKLSPWGIVLIVIIAFLFLRNSFDVASRLEGKWICEEVHDDYPDQMIFQSEGIVIADGIPCTWSILDDELQITVGNLGSLTYKFKLGFFTLYLDEYKYNKD